MDKAVALHSALLQALGAVPLHPPKEVRLLDVVSVPSLKRTGKRASVRADEVEVAYEEPGFCDCYLGSTELWSSNVASDVKRLLQKESNPVDLVVVDEEIETVAAKPGALAKQAKRIGHRRGVVVKIITGRLDAVCACDATDAGAEDILTGDDEGSAVREVPLSKHGVIAVDVLCVDKDGEPYMLAQRMLDHLD